MTDTGEVIDPRIQTIKNNWRNFDIEITNHSLYLYGTKRQNKKSRRKDRPKHKTNYK
jgi:Fur family ferric uptake transcriptional regulator